MTCCSSTISHALPLVRKISLGGPNRDSKLSRYRPYGLHCFSVSYQLLSNTRPTGNRLPNTLIHVLDDYSLLNIFSFCRPLILDENETADYEVQVRGAMELRTVVVHPCAHML